MILLTIIPKWSLKANVPHTGVDVQMRVNKGEDNNIHMLRQSPHDFFVHYYSKPEVFYTNGCYCFRGVE